MTFEWIIFQIEHAELRIQQKYCHATVAAAFCEHLQLVKQG